MKANELMIGDWVLLTDGPARVISIAQGGIYFEDRFGEGICSFDKINPIPLTAEILEENGWEWNKYELLFIADEHDMPTLRWGYDEECENLWWFKHLGPIARVKYVHELQHALRLCGIEKEIEL